MARSYRSAKTVDHPSQRHATQLLYTNTRKAIAIVSTTVMKIRIASAWQTIAVLLLLGGAAQASLGDRLPDFKDCVQVRKT
jgi:hypothetical protein